MTIMYQVLLILNQQAKLKADVSIHSWSNCDIMKYGIKEEGAGHPPIPVGSLEEATTVATLLNEESLRHAQECRDRDLDEKLSRGGEYVQEYVPVYARRYSVEEVWDNVFLPEGDRRGPGSKNLN